MTTGTMCRAEREISSPCYYRAISGCMNIWIRCSEFPVLQTKNEYHKDDKQACYNDTGPLQDFFKSSHDGWFWSAQYMIF